jgi:glutathione peroxidase
MHLFKILITGILFTTSSIYNITVTDTQAANIPLNNYQQKLMLIVNIATDDSARTPQLAGLQQLQQQFANSLVVIGFPSNSFGHEPRSNAAIKQFCQTTYGVSFLLAAQGPVKGATIQPVYNWLTKLTENGAMNTEVKGDFQKYLIDRNGNLVGVFSGKVLPMDNQIVSAINANLN